MRFFPLAAVPLLASLLLAAGAAGQPAEGQSAPAAIEQYSVAAQLQKLQQYDLAGDEWRKLLEEHPDDPLAAAARHYAGVCAFQQGNFAEAAEQFQAFLQRHPDHDLTDATLTNLGLAQYNLAQAAAGDQATERLREAVATFDEHRQRFPDSDLAAESAFYRAEALYGLGQTTDALAAYRQWLADHTDHPLAVEVRLALASTLVEAGEPSAAIEVLDKLPAGDLTDELAARAAITRGEAHLALEQYRQAADAFAEAAGEGVAEADYALQSQASALFQAGAFAEAAAAYESIGERFPDSPLVAESLAGAGRSQYQAQNFPRAAELLSQAYQQEPEQPDHAHWWIRALLEAGEAEQALTAADSVLERHAEPQILLDKADALYALDDRRADSVAAYLAAADAGEGATAAEALHLAAATALELGQTDDAVRHARRLLDQHADSSFAPDARRTLAEAHLLSGEAAAAAELFRELVDSTTGSEQHELRVRLAWAQSTAGDERAVVDTLQPVADQLTGATAMQGRYLLGRALLRTGEAPEAVAQLRPAANAEAGGEWAVESRLVLARALTATGDFPAAIATLKPLVDDPPNADVAARATYRRAEAHQQAGDYPAAAADYDHLAATWPDHPLAAYAAYRAAMAMVDAEEFADAHQRLTEFLARYVDHPLTRQAQLAHGTCLAELERWDEAIAVLRSVAESEGDLGLRDRAWYELAWAYRNAGRAEEHREALGKLVAGWPDSPLAADALFRLGESYYDAEQFDLAAEQFQAAAGHAAATATLKEKAMHLVGWSQWKGDAPAEAAEAFAAQRERFPDGPLAADALWMQGEAQFAAKQYADALAKYEAAAEATASDDRLAALGMLHAGQAAGQLEKWQASADWLQRALDRFPDYEGRHELQCELGWALTKLDRHDQAAELLTKVADADNSPVGARARFLLGELQFAQQAYEAAVRSFFKVAYGYGDREAPEAYHPWQAESLFEAARCLEQLDRRSAARKLYEELVERFPDEPKAELASRRLGLLDE